MKPSSGAPTHNSPRKLSLCYNTPSAQIPEGTGIISIGFAPDQLTDETTVNAFLEPLFEDACAEADRLAPRPISQWLRSIDPVLRVYAHSFTDYGYGDVRVLMSSVYEYQMVKLFDLLGMSEQHRAVILAAFAKLEFDSS
jgi:hypothetical protein